MCIGRSIKPTFCARASAPPRRSPGALDHHLFDLIFIGFVLFLALFGIHFEDSTCFLHSFSSMSLSCVFIDFGMISGIILDAFVIRISFALRPCETFKFACISNEFACSYNADKH